MISYQIKKVRKSPNMSQKMKHLLIQINLEKRGNAGEISIELGIVLGQCEFY